jgi:hypothetical protein
MANNKRNESVGTQSTDEGTESKTGRTGEVERHALTENRRRRSRSRRANKR